MIGRECVFQALNSIKLIKLLLGFGILMCSAVIDTPELSLLRLGAWNVSVHWPGLLFPTELYVSDMSPAHNTCKTPTSTSVLSWR